MQFSGTHAPQGQPGGTPVRTPITLGCCNAFGGQTPHGGGDYEEAHWRPHLYVNVEDSSRGGAALGCTSTGAKVVVQNQKPVT